MNLSRVQASTNRNKINDIIRGNSSISVSQSLNVPRMPGGHKASALSTSVDLTGRLGGRIGRTEQGGILRSNVDRANNHLEQILSKHENSIAKSMIVNSEYDGQSLKLLGHQSTRNKHPYRTRDINEVNVNVIPPPTSVNQQMLL